jgi:hypothetical protein
MAGPSLEDLNQMFGGCLVIYKNKPYWFTRFNNQKTVQAFDLSTQRNVVLEGVNYQDVKAPGRCFGYVNISDFVLYLARNPIRRYKVGAYREAMRFEAPERYNDAHHVRGYANVVALTAPEVCDTIFNRYPDIPTIRTMLEGGSRIVAFDRQFAIDYKLVVYYKNKPVGKLDKNNQVVFDKDFKHLICLLDNNHEKSIPILE